MNACDQCRDRLMDLLYQESGEVRDQDLDQHLAQCPECAREFRELQQTLGAVRSLPDPALPAHLNTRVKALAREALGQNRRSARRWFMRPALAAAAVLVLAVSITFIVSEQLPTKNDSGPLAAAGATADHQTKEIALLTAPQPKPEAPGEDPGKSAPDLAFDRARDKDFSALTEKGLFETPPPPVGSGADDFREDAKKPMAMKMDSDRDADTVGNKVEPPAQDEEITPPAGDLLVAKNEAPQDLKKAAKDRESPASPATVDKEKKREDKPAAEPRPQPGPVGDLAEKPKNLPETKLETKPETPPATSPPTSAPKMKAAPEKSKADGGRGFVPAPAPPREEAPSDAMESNEDLAAPGTGAGDGAGSETGAEGSTGGLDLLAQASAQEGEGRYKKALTLYEQVLDDMGYEPGAAEKQRREESKSGTASPPDQALTAAGEDGASAPPACTPQLKAAADGAIRCYRKLLMFGKAKHLETWRRRVCP